MKEAASKKPSAIGVICEFNPLHNGHVYLLAEARRLVGEDGCVICVMSGQSTQRGDVAMIEPFTRGAMALTGGADLVVELPFPWCSGSAEAFAMGGVQILSEMGVSNLIFGSECGDLALLTRGVELIRSQEFLSLYAELCRDGMGTAAAYAKALHTLDESLPQSFPSSNDLLGIAYLAAVRTLTRNMVAHTIKRRGQDYRDELLTDAAFPSATSLRNLIFEASCDPDSLALILESTMPKQALEILLSEIREERAPIDPLPLLCYAHMYFRLADTSPSDIAETGGGLWAHLHKCALSTDTSEAFLSAAATRQYTNARLRRAILFGITGVTMDDIALRPSYTQVLAANQRGRAYLAMLRKNSSSSLAVITKPADAPEGRQRALNEKMDAVFAACLPQPRDAGWLMRKATHISE